MLSVKSLSGALAEKLTGITGQKDLAPKITYGLEMVIGETTKAICLLVIAYLLDQLRPTIFLMLSIVPLRTIVGGGHCTSSLRCLISSMITYLILAEASSFLAKTVPLVYLLGFCLTSFIAFTFIVDRYGPGNSVNYPNPSLEVIEKVKRRIFGTMTIYTIVILNTFYLVKENISLLLLSSAAIGVLWQSLMTTTYGHRLIATLDRGLLFAKIK